MSGQKVKHGATLSDIEQQILGWVDARREEAVHLLEKVVNTNSGTMNHNGVRAVGRIFRKQFDRLGFETRWIPQDKVRRAGHLFAELDSGTGPRILLIGHLDTVFEPSSPFQRFQRNGRFAVGPGVIDMQGGNITLLFALKALEDSGLLRSKRIVVALPGDEEDTGFPLELSRLDLLDAARRSDIALGFEGAGKDLFHIVIARRGYTHWSLRVEGQQAHSARIFSEAYGCGAIFGAAHILNRFREELREPNLTYGPAVIAGGTRVSYTHLEHTGTIYGKTNVIPRDAIVEGDLRFASPEQRDRAKQRMEAIVAAPLSGTKAHITFVDSYPAMEPSDKAQEMLGQLNSINRSLALEELHPFDPMDRGAADVSFAAPLVEASLDGLGPVGWGGHTREETIDLESLSVVIGRAAILIQRLCT